MRRAKTAIKTLVSGFSLPVASFSYPARKKSLILRLTFLLLLSFQNKGNAEAAIQDFSSIIRLSPDNPDGWIKRAEVQSTCLWKQWIASRSKHVFLLGLPPGKDFNIIMWQLIEVFLTFWEDDLRPTLMFLPCISQFFCLFSWPPKYTFNLMVFRRKFWNEILPY